MHDEMEKFINTNVISSIDSSSITLWGARLIEPWQSRTNTHALTYGDGFSGSRKLKEAICHFLNAQFAPTTTLTIDHLTVTSGVSNAIECCAWALADVGDYIMVGRPYFNAFKTTFGTRPG